MQSLKRAQLRERSESGAGPIERAELRATCRGCKGLSGTSKARQSDGVRQTRAKQAQ